ncbi:hypothetical protein AUR64_17545 [Haloprofundus marisrubri]|uniref:Uncharacterized protein n=1 Tax=Haloprofundus marisrubri TaxID=1514971 RepID=A0A0W1R557_9EURY|nr:hypothetical protein [Haloprofundus marisrubri]KTG08488.1 hypothetical protein AUR64_17545 [Haloprofundus marisrubri]
MNRRRYLRVAGGTALSLGLAGCSALQSGTEPGNSVVEGSSSTDAPTETPPAETSTPASTADLPPGVSEDGVEDAWELAVAHHDALEAASFTSEQTNLRRVYDDENRVVERGESVWTGRVSAGGERLHAVYRPGPETTFWSQRPTGNRIEWWADDETALQREETENGPEYRRIDMSAETGGQGFVQVAAHSGKSRIESELASAGLRGTEPYDDTTLSWLTWTAPPEIRTQFDRGLTQTRSVGVVRAGGRFEEIRTSYQASHDAGRQFTTTTHEFRGVGETTVERPDWYEEAIEATK